MHDKSIGGATWLAMAAGAEMAVNREGRLHFKTLPAAHGIAERMAKCESAKPRRRKRVPKRLRA